MPEHNWGEMTAFKCFAQCFELDETSWGLLHEKQAISIDNIIIGRRRRGIIDQILRSLIFLRLSPCLTAMSNF